MCIKNSSRLLNEWFIRLWDAYTVMIIIFFNWFQNLVGKSRVCISEIALMGKKAVHVELLYLVFLGTSTMNMIHVLEDMRSQTRYCEFSANSSRTFNCTVSLHRYLYPKDNHTLAQVYQNLLQSERIFLSIFGMLLHISWCQSIM